MNFHRQHPPPLPSSDASFALEGDTTSTPLPSDSLLIFLLHWQPGCRGFTVTFPSLLRTCFAASLNICTVGNPFLSSMGRSQSRVIVEVVAPVSLLPGIALSPWITVRYGRHRRKVVISFRSSFPRTSILIGRTVPLPHLVFVLWLGYSQHPPPGSVALASGHHSPRFLLGLVDSLDLTRHTFYH